MSYLGMDVGTTGCKAVVFNESGEQIALAYRDYPVLSPREGWAELDTALVLDRCVEAVREAAAACAGDPIRAMGVSSQGEAFTPVGPDGEILGNAMVSSDARAANLSAEWSRQFGAERLYQITGHTSAAIFTLFKLLWLRDNLPEIWGNARAFYCFEELLHWRLGIEPAISWPLAGRTMLFDVRKHEWSPEILDAVGLDSSKLARPLPSGAVVGTIPANVANELGLPDGVKVVAGGHDQTCGALGAGVVVPGRAVYGMGTVDCITPAFGSAVFSEDLFASNLATYDFTVPGMYTTVAYSLTGGNLLQWFRDQFGDAEAAQARQSGGSAYDQLLAGMPDEPTNLVVLPYFTPSGTPYFDTQVPGAILGLRLSTTKHELLRGLLEGVAYEMRLNLDILNRSGIPVDELVAIGGGARNRKWLQLKADVLNTPIAVAAVTEAGCMGVAMLGASAVTGETVTNLARRWVRIVDVVQPNPVNAATYGTHYQSYTRLYPAIKELCKSK